MTFSTDITKFIKKTQLSADSVLRKLGFDAFGGVLKRSPVDTGRFRSSNRISINSPDVSVEADRGPSTGKGGAPYPGGPELNKASQMLQSASFGDTLHITNNLPYARPLEDGSSQQTNRQPDGIYGATYQELIANFAKTVRSARL